MVRCYYVHNVHDVNSYDMTREEFVEIFNSKRSIEARKLNTKILTLLESKFEFKGPYYDHSEEREKISVYLSGLDSNIYIKLSGGKSKRKRDPSLLKNTKIEIRSFPYSEEVGYSWRFLADDLVNKRQYFWNSSKQNDDREKKKNQIYFNPQEAIDDFLNLKLKKYPLSNDDKINIIGFLEKYGPYFIRYYGMGSLTDKEWYFWHFWMDYDSFKKSYKIIESEKSSKFPNAKCPPRILNKLYKTGESKDYTKWNEEIRDPQLHFNLCLHEGRLPTKNNGPQDIHYLGRGIGILSNYLNLNSKRLIVCEYPKCEKKFFQRRKNQLCCCPHHTLLVKNQRYKQKKKKI